MDAAGSSSAPNSLAGARALFDLPDDVTYLNCAFMGPLPRIAVEAGWSGLARKAQPWTVAVDDFTVPVDQLRGVFAGLLGAPDDTDGIAITPSVSYGVSTAAANVTMAPGQVALVLDQQFPSDVYAWRGLADGHDGAVHTVARPADGDWTSAVLADLEALGDRVAVASVPPCHWIDGGRVDLVAVGEALRKVGAALAVDTCQSLGAMPFDVGEVRPDFVFGATYKWLCGPYSLGFLWASPEHRSGHPIEHSWSGRANSACLACLADYTDEFQPGARRYDMGEVANFALVPAALAAGQLVSSWNPQVTAAHARALTDRIAEGAQALGLSVADRAHRAPHLLGLRLDAEVDAEALAPRLADQGIHVSVRGDAVRVSAHGFNIPDDAERLIDGLAQALGRSA